MDCFSEFFRESQIRLAGFTPHQIRIRCISQTPRNRLLDTRLGFEEAFNGALAGQECLVVVIHVGRQQVSRFRVGTSDHQSRGARHVGSQTRRIQLLDCFACRNQHFAAHVAALLDRGQLVFEVNASSTGIDHRLHQLIGIQHAAETCFRVSDDRCEEIDIALALGPLDLVGALEGVVDALDDHRY